MKSVYCPSASSRTTTGTSSDADGFRIQEDKQSSYKFYDLMWTCIWMNVHFLHKKECALNKQALKRKLLTKCTSKYEMHVVVYYLLVFR